MCKKYVLASEPERIESRFNVRLDPSFEAISKNYAVVSGDYSYVITRENTNHLEVHRFGMTPFFAKEPIFPKQSARLILPTPIRGTIITCIVSVSWDREVFWEGLHGRTRVFLPRR
jgi:putative SOS response-associated peptidase YedK